MLVAHVTVIPIRDQRVAVDGMRVGVMIQSMIIIYKK